MSHIGITLFLALELESITWSHPSTKLVVSGHTLGSPRRGGDRRAVSPIKSLFHLPFYFASNLLMCTIYVQCNPGNWQILDNNQVCIHYACGTLYY